MLSRKLGIHDSEVLGMTSWEETHLGLSVCFHLCSFGDERSFTDARKTRHKWLSSHVHMPILIVSCKYYRYYISHHEMLVAQYSNPGN